MKLTSSKGVAGATIRFGDGDNGRAASDGILI
ncbi:hypothetical protein BCEN4_2430007 [Burkholderia cenocepacia]|nr:hypothetical protein BCEN4_2430007 [Burkholderia cenocepacia]